MLFINISVGRFIYFKVLYRSMYERELIGLSKSGSRYLVIGAIAVGLYGFPRATFDLDILPDLNPDNLEKIITTLTDLGYKPKMPIELEELKNPKKREEWYKDRHMRVFSFFDVNDPRNIVDLMIYSPLNFEECFERRQTIDLEGNNIYLASVSDLLKLKKEAMREKDLVDISVLKELEKLRKNKK